MGVQGSHVLFRVSLHAPDSVFIRSFELLVSLTRKSNPNNHDSLIIAQSGHT
jgi:hypothetical protein